MTYFHVEPKYVDERKAPAMADLAKARKDVAEAEDAVKKFVLGHGGRKTGAEYRELKARAQTCHEREAIHEAYIRDVCAPDYFSSTDVAAAVVAHLKTFEAKSDEALATFIDEVKNVGAIHAIKYGAEAVDADRRWQIASGFLKMAAERVPEGKPVTLKTLVDVANEFLEELADDVRGAAIYRNARTDLSGAVDGEILAVSARETSKRRRDGDSVFQWLDWVNMYDAKGRIVCDEPEVEEA